MEVEVEVEAGGRMVEEEVTVKMRSFTCDNFPWCTTLNLVLGVH